MKLEDQVCSLELSKRLKELGVKQESLFYYSEKDDLCKLWYGLSVCLIKEQIIYYNNDFENYSAFTASELLEFIPKKLIHSNGKWELPLSIETNSDFFEVIYNDYLYESEKIIIKDNYLINAIAKMLIHLIENNLLEIKQ